MFTRMQQRRGTAAQWAAANPVLADGELGLETDTKVFKVGNGVATWNTLPPVQQTAFDTRYAPLGTTETAAHALATFSPVKNGVVQTVLHSGLAEGANGTSVLGVLNDKLYMFGSEGETTGALAGVSVIEEGVVTNLGSPAGTPDFNRFTAYGAVEYKGNLYVGDRRSGNLYKLILDGNGQLTSLNSIGTLPSHEDIFPGPVLWNMLLLGSYGRDNGGDLANANCMVMAYDGTTVFTVLEFPALGGGAEVRSMVAHQGELWVSVVKKDRSLCEVWVIDNFFRSRRVYSNTTPYVLASWQGDLVGCLDSYDNVASALPKLVVWKDGQFVRISADFADIGNLMGLLPVGDSLYIFHYYQGIYRFRDDTVTRISTAPPRVVSATVHDGALWMVGNQPAALYKMTLGTDMVTKALSQPQQHHGSRVDRWTPGISRARFARPSRYLSPQASSIGTLAFPWGNGYAVPIFLPAGFYDSLHFEVTTYGGAANTFRMWLYSDDAKGYPGVVVSNGTVSVTSTGFKTVSIGTIFLPAGLYHIGIASQSNVAQSTLRWAYGGGDSVIDHVALDAVAQQGFPMCHIDTTGDSTVRTTANWPTTENVDVGAPKVYIHRTAT